MTAPEPPRNVRIERRDGTVIPCELVYVGQETADDGQPMDVWDTVTETRLNLREGDKLRADMIPGRCSISIPADARGPLP